MHVFQLSYKEKVCDMQLMTLGRKVLMLCPQSVASEPGRKLAIMRTWIQKQLRLRAKKLRWKLTGQ